ncbi:hypothetical protein [Streptomyces sp. NPDC001665]
MSSAPRTRRCLAVATISAALVAGSLLLAPAAQATPVGILCAPGSTTAHYSPPLTTVSRPTAVDIQDDYSCTSLLTPGISSANGSYSYTQDSSCSLTIGSGGTQTVVYHWNNGQSSTVEFTSYTVVRAANGTATVTALGAVTDGLGQGQPVTRVVIAPVLDLTACTTTGIAAQTAPATLAII